MQRRPTVGTTHPRVPRVLYVVRHGDTNTLYGQQLHEHSRRALAVVAFGDRDEADSYRRSLQAHWKSEGHWPSANSCPLPPRGDAHDGATVGRVAPRVEVAKVLSADFIKRANRAGVSVAYVCGGSVQAFETADSTRSNAVNCFLDNWRL